ncbi:Insulinase (Peptidase family M16) [uncultured archaeon]|nr:Insulinase (Peptidase family M16) [uncultured archaeon]
MPTFKYITKYVFPKRDELKAKDFREPLFSEKKEMKYTKRFMKRLAIGAVLLLIVLSGLAYYYRNPVKLVDVPLTSLQEKLDVTKLDNGMTVTIKEMKAVPLVTIQFWVHVGSKNEPEQYRGIAHIFEHIWFKGTATQPVGSFHKRVESLGGELNAMTSQDWTMYYVTVPSDKFDEIFPYMTDLLLNPAFDNNEIEKEKKVVLEEQSFSFNEPEKFLDDQFGLLLVDKHPYRNPVIGYKNTISAANREEIINFYKTWYVPNNMNIIVVGNINKEKTLEKIKQAFAGFKQQELPALDLPKESPLSQ